MDIIVKILESVLSWPVAAVILGLLFRQELRGVLQRVQQVKAGKIVVTLERLADLAAKGAERQAAEPSQTDIRSIVKGAFEDIGDILQTSEEIRADTFRTLWVDDQPENNDAERSALGQFGFRFTLARSTADAQGYLDSEDFDLVISDMRRPESDTAGFDLLAWMHERGIQVPYIIYCGQLTPDRRRRAQELGTHGITVSPNRLVRFALEAVKQPRTARLRRLKH